MFKERESNAVFIVGKRARRHLGVRSLERMRAASSNPNDYNLRVDDVI